MEITEYKEEINRQLADKETFSTLVTTTFKGLAPTSVKRAILEGMMRGFKFKDFLEKNVYAIPFRDSYSLVTSVDYARKVGMRSGVVGVSEPVYEENDKGIISCAVTVKRKVNEYVGEYTAKVYFSEYNTGNNLWKSKPRTMIAKVAEMHALRKACPEEMAQSYIEEEMHAEAKVVVEVPVEPHKLKLEAAKSLEEVKQVWSDMPIEAKQKLGALKDIIKAKYANA